MRGVVLPRITAGSIIDIVAIEVAVAVEVVVHVDVDVTVSPTGAPTPAAAPHCAHRYASAECNCPRGDCCSSSIVWRIVNRGIWIGGRPKDRSWVI